MTQAHPVQYREYLITGLGRINVLLGKNGCGKSTALRAVHQAVDGHSEGAQWALAKYITPERSGSLDYDPNIENNISNNPGWLASTRLVNQFTQFKQQTMAQYRQLEIRVSRLFQQAHRDGLPVPPYFADYADRINGLLDNVEIREEGMTFKIYDRESSAVVPAGNISSGESELIGLAIEALVFALSVSTEQRGVLLLDEPDVHLHPDLQARMVTFLVALVTEYEFDLVIATHSTPILGELVRNTDANICLMQAHEKSLLFRPVDNIYAELLPVFGAHPLTEIFNNTRTLLVEGDDDVRIWQEAMKSSNGSLKLTPVGCGGRDNMLPYEERLGQIMASVYDDGVAYALRDRDDGPEFIEDLPPVIRMRLSCRTAENLLLSDEVLTSVGLEWSNVKSRVREWCENESNSGHEKYSSMKAFLDGAFQRKSWDLKEIRMLLVGQILASNKPWEVLVGKAISRVHSSPDNKSLDNEDSLRAYLGQKVIETLEI